MKFPLIKKVYAHCDVPCGIYETDSMRHAAATCLRMIEKIEDLGEIDTTEKQNNFIRMVNTKEKHASKCKQELYILWSDFFKPEHLDKFPDLHEKFWQATKQCSKVKQTVNKNECQKLADMVHEISHMFSDAQNSTTH